jgi:hypothetical protein
MQRNIRDERKIIREKERMTRPPRLEGDVKKARMSSPEKPKGKAPGKLATPRYSKSRDDAPRRATVPKQNPGAEPGRTNLPA